MMNHTPGPWQVNGSHIYTADPERAMLAQVFNPGSKASDFPLSANARLMAAAPTLLEALQALMRVHDEPAGFAGYYGRQLDLAIELQIIKVDKATALARAAIANATGEQS